MANNRRDRDKGDGSQGEGLSAGGGMPSEPEIVSVTVHPTPTLAVSLKPAQQGDIWASLLESSPWSANHGGRIEPVQLSPAPTRPTESPSVGDLVSRWSQPIWRTPSRVEEVEIPESNFVIELEASQPITSDITVSVSDLVIEVQPIQTTEAEPEPELPVAEPELVHEAAVSEPVAESIEDAVAVPAPATNFGLAELMQAAAAMAPVLASPPSVAPAAKPVREPAKKRKAPPVRKKVATVQDVPVEDLLGGIFGIAGSAVRGVFTIGSGFVDGVVKGGRLVGSNVAAGTRRLAQTIEGSCGSCSSPKCDAEDKKK